MADGGRVLVTNGHPMSSTELLSQRYMRAMAHIPLLSIDNPETVLVICYGVGNTAHAATLHPSVRRVEVVDLSRHVLDHSSYFKDTNGDVLKDPHVSAMSTMDGITCRLQRVLVRLDHAGHHRSCTREWQRSIRGVHEKGRTAYANGYMSSGSPRSGGVPQALILSMISSFVEGVPERRAAVRGRSNLLLIGYERLAE